jgi:hypothetical protein
VATTITGLDDGYIGPETWAVVAVGDAGWAAVGTEGDDVAPVTVVEASQSGRYPGLEKTQVEGTGARVEGIGDHVVGE